jgi:hypothetical protein
MAARLSWCCPAAAGASSRGTDCRVIGTVNVRVHFFDKQSAQLPKDIEK